jgi:hypothetical protein
MRQHSATLSITIITLLLAACSEQGGTPQGNQPTPNPPAPGTTPTKAKFDKPLVPAKKDNPAEKEGQKPPTETATGKVSGEKQGLLVSTDPDLRVIRPKGRKDPFEIVSIQPTLTPIIPEQKSISGFRQLPAFPKIPEFTGLDKSNLGAIPSIPRFPQLPNFSGNANKEPSLPPSAIPPLPSFPQLPSFGANATKEPGLPPSAIPPLPSFPELPNFKPPGGSTSGGQNSPISIGGKTPGVSKGGIKTPPITKGSGIKTPPIAKGSGTQTHAGKKPTTPSKIATKPLENKPFSLAKPRQPLILPPHQQIPVFKPELPKLPEPTIAQTVEVSGLIAIGNQSYAIVKAPNEPYSRRVKVGERISNGQVLVKRIDVNNKLVVLEQYGVEINKVLTESAPAKQV